MSKLMGLFRSGANGSNTEAIRQSTSMTMAYLLEQNRKFESFMRQKVEKLEERVSAQLIRDEIEDDDYEVDRVDPAGETQDEPVLEVTSSSSFPGEEDEPLKTSFGMLSTRTADNQETTFSESSDGKDSLNTEMDLPEATDSASSLLVAAEALSVDKSPESDPQQNQEVDWMSLLGDQGETPKRSETASLVIIRQHDDDPEADVPELEEKPAEADAGWINPALEEEAEEDPEVLEEEQVEIGEEWGVSALEEETTEEGLEAPEEDQIEIEEEGSPLALEETTEEDLAELEEEQAEVEEEMNEPEPTVAEMSQKAEDATQTKPVVRPINVSTQIKMTSTQLDQAEEDSDSLLPSWLKPQL